MASEGGRRSQEGLTEDAGRLLSLLALLSVHWVKTLSCGQMACVGAQDPRSGGRGAGDVP